MDLRRLDRSDRSAWSELWRGYLDFYGHPLPAEITDTSWERLVGPDDAMLGLGAIDDGALVGICHLVFHPSTWSSSSYCYLEDLFVAPERRSSGIGRALLDAARDEARGAGSSKLYWQTHAGNTAARRLYDGLAEHRGFVVYEVDL